MTIPPEVRERGKTAVATFKKIMRKHGPEGYKFALMCALQEAPGLMTDVVFFQGKKRLADEHNELQLRSMKRALKKQNFRPNPNDVYVPALGRFQWDKEAFVPATGGRGYIKKLCESRGTGCEGAVSVTARQDPPAPDKKMSDAMISQNIVRHIQKNPDLARKPTQELREMVIEKHAFN